MLVSEPLPPCDCANNQRNDITIILYSFIINLAGTGVMLLAFLNKIKDIIEIQKYDQLEQCEP